MPESLARASRASERTEWEATLRFWDAHLKPGLNVIVIGNAPLFFRDRDVQAVLSKDVPAKSATSDARSGDSQ